MKEYELEITIYAKIKAKDKRQAKTLFAKQIKEIKTKQVQEHAYAWRK